MNNNYSELFITKIGKYLPFIYPQIESYEIAIILISASISYILHICAAITIIKSWKVTDVLKSAYFKAVVFGSFTDIINNFCCNLTMFSNQIKPIVDYLEHNYTEIHLIIFDVAKFISNITYYIQIVNFFFISIIRFVAVYFPLNGNMLIEKKYIYFQTIVVFYSIGLTSFKRIYCIFPYKYWDNSVEYTRGEILGGFTCSNIFNLSVNNYYYIMIIFVHSLIIISIILTISVLYKIKKVRIIKSTVHSDNLNKEKREIHILSNFFFNLYTVCTQGTIIVEYLKNNQSTIHLILWILIIIIMHWTYYTQNVNILFISTIRFISVFFPNNINKIIETNYIFYQSLVVVYSFGITLLKKIYCTFPYDYSNDDPRYFDGGKIGKYQCKYFLDMSKSEHYYSMVGLIHSLIIISIISTIAVLYKIRKINHTKSFYHQNDLTKQKKEYRLTRYVIVLICLKIIRLIEDQLYYMPVKINGYDESLFHINTLEKYHIQLN
ncbi:GPCR, rhodopsin-like, 7TM domain and 7TM GPCR,serpentine receptor class v (Srv) family-containing protein [Strongyloides ratti]|uniref:GPCR, rhodopsin-like, 7TM domain and 7TM GPCR,serpentine receptor class v (Srv) family-containing protein n=1 Tax=Strongyloides ratti TaxID=34506 RepID=A0A090MSQ8_STRRB|nr:GPCR, rhodopsin-like, 7TM domain and 7TM GPCR,serpentine receptor class v (Srv) family-containing protein [Strongyloides ratti]CEF61328.1 GPCR, rhodopsin-like, 7TM domain and 7TM GPCR,serpentine receptor class v (Srv) family-containing protein [Strongyloides ratti]